MTSLWILSGVFLCSVVYLGVVDGENTGAVTVTGFVKTGVSWQSLCWFKQYPVAHYTMYVDVYTTMGEKALQVRMLYDGTQTSLYSKNETGGTVNISFDYDPLLWEGAAYLNIVIGYLENKVVIEVQTSYSASDVGSIDVDYSATLTSCKPFMCNRDQTPYL